MKAILPVFISLTFFLFLSPTFLKAQNSDKKAYPIQIEHMEVTKINEISSLAKNIMNGMKSGNYYILSEEEAISPFINIFTPRAQSEAYTKIRKQLGDYPGRLKFVEAYDIIGEDNNFVLYRFESDFALIKSEIRLYYLKKQDKLAGFYIIPWLPDIPHQVVRESSNSNF